MTVRFLLIAGILAVALGLVGITLTLAQEGIPAVPGQSESEREVAAAAALEANPPLALRATRFFTPPAVITAPLLVGVSEDNEFVYLVDPISSTHTPLFDGDEVWGAAFDYDNQRLYYVHGPTLVDVPFDGSAGMAGSIVGGESGDLLSMVGLAYHDGALYGTRINSSKTDPEGIYTIDPATLSATLLLTYSVPNNTVDIGGLAVDPASGDLYGTNDTLPLRGLVKIGLDGSLDVVAPYPNGESDLDGLAIGDGRAYLVPDEPGSIYVFDMTTLTYTTPLTNPWTSSELFAAAAWLREAPVLTPTIALSKTVGVDPNACAATTNITVTAGTEVYYCYEVTNSGQAPLSYHTVEDSELGVIIEDFAYTLSPAASAFITKAAVISATTVNTATWTAFNQEGIDAAPTDVVTATAAATVTVPEPTVALSKTVGTDPNACATATALAVAAGTEVTYCYEIANTGSVTVTRHTLEDSHLGTLLEDFAYPLAPGASAFITETATITETTINTATWTAYNPGPLDVATAMATATVTIEEETAPDIEVAPAALAAALEPDGQITQSVTISNTGTAVLNWSLFFAPEECATPGALLWASADKAGGATAPGATEEVNVTFNAAGSPTGELSGVLCIASDDPDEPVISVPLELAIQEIRVLLPVIARP